MKAISGQIIVKVSSEYKERLDYKTLSLEVSENQAAFNQDRRTFAQCSGEIIAVCDSVPGLGKGYDLQVEVGDKVYFHFNSIGEHSRLKWMEDKVHQILYQHLFCKVTDTGDLLMLNSRVLCSKLYEEGVVDGLRYRNGMIIEMNVPHNQKKARVEHIGDPYPFDPVLDVKAGDTIFMEAHSDFENEIEGKTYFVMSQENLLGKEI